MSGLPEDTASLAEKV